MNGFLDDIRRIFVQKIFQQFILMNILIFFPVEADALSQRTCRSSLSVNEAIISSGNRDFKILVGNKSNTKHCIHLVAPTIQDKEAWISDILQCIANMNIHTMDSPTTESIGL